MKTKVVNKCGGKNSGCYFETIIVDYVSPIEAKTRTKIIYKICLN